MTLLRVTNQRFALLFRPIISRMVACLAAAILIVCALNAGAAMGADAKQAPERIALWPKSSGRTGAITVHPAKQPNSPAMIICPGGGYGGLVTGAEGHGIAKWLNGLGMTGIVLEYELPKGRSNVPLEDAQRAIRLARANASEWKLNPERLGIIGFSAGGHLASTAGTHYDAGNADSNDPVERFSCRPDFMTLIYPVISMNEKTHSGSKRNLLGANPSAELVKNFSNELQVTEDTPPALLAHAKDDRVVVPENSRLFHKAMLANKRPSIYIELESGGHGLNGYKGESWDQWQASFKRWMMDDFGYGDAQ